MTASTHRLVFGPVPSRRLGHSLGINNVAAKTCSYDCIYCKLGQTADQRIRPRGFFDPQTVRQAVSRRLAALDDESGQVDYLSFVPDGEPTLDRRLGATIEALLDLGRPLAVLSNASLLWQPQVREHLARADLVSIKVDCVDEAVWRRINRPHPSLDLAGVLAGIRDFAAGFGGTLITETMLIAGVNDAAGTLARTADFLASLHPRTACLALPTRTPRRARVHGSDEVTVARARAIYRARLPEVVLLARPGEGDFGASGDAREDLLAITAVQPLRESALRRLLEQDGSGWELVESLLAEGELLAMDYRGERHYLRPAAGRAGRGSR